MNEIQLVMEVGHQDTLIRAWEWPQSREMLRASLRASPSHPRAPVELLQALAQWQGRRVHAAVVVGGPDGSCVGRLFPDLLEPEPTALVQVSFVERRPCGASPGWRPPAPSACLVRRAERPVRAGGER